MTHFNSIKELRKLYLILYIDSNTYTNFNPIQNFRIAIEDFLSKTFKHEERNISRVCKLVFHDYSK